MDIGGSPSPVIPKKTRTSSTRSSMPASATAKPCCSTLEASKSFHKCWPNWPSMCGDGFDIPAHTCHSSGNFSLYDPTADILFSGDIGAALVPSHETGLMVTDFDQHVEYMRGFHLRWMPSTSALRSWTQRVHALKPNMICPQHGSAFQGEMVVKLLDWLDTLEVGQWNDTASANEPQKAA